MRVCVCVCVCLCLFKSCPPDHRQCKPTSAGLAAAGVSELRAALVVDGRHRAGCAPRGGGPAAGLRGHPWGLRTNMAKHTRARTRARAHTHTHTHTHTHMRSHSPIPGVPPGRRLPHRRHRRHPGHTCTHTLSLSLSPLHIPPAPGGRLPHRRHRGHPGQHRRVPPVPPRQRRLRVQERRHEQRAVQRAVPRHGRPVRG